MKKIKQYVKVDENNNVIKTRSECFMTDYTDWIEVGESADTHYNLVFKSPEGYHNYKVKDGKVIERTATDINKDKLDIVKEDKINDVKANTREIAIKALLNTYKTAEDSLINQINNCTTITQVDNITDTRS
jgi:hypothetical protein